MTLYQTSLSKGKEVNEEQLKILMQTVSSLINWLAKLSCINIKHQTNIEPKLD